MVLNKDFTEELLPAGELTGVMEATLNGDAEEVSRLLKEGADPNEQEPEGGTTALILAADNDQFGVSANFIRKWGGS